jgi:hypothetical protein
MVNKRKNVTETMDSDEEEGQDGEDDSPVPPVNTSLLDRHDLLAESTSRIAKKAKSLE